jgi:hypothetical protein
VHGQTRPTINDGFMSASTLFYIAFFAVVAVIIVAILAVLMFESEEPASAPGPETTEPAEESRR